MTEETPVDPLPGDGPPQAIPPAAAPPTAAIEGGAVPMTGDPLPATMPAQNERTMAMLCHLSALAGLIGIPFGHVLGPLVVWMIKKDESAFVNDQGKEALNFQISTTIYLVVFVILSFLLIGIPLLIALVIFWLVIVIVAAVKANEGVPYRYPLTIRLIN
jgi:uncharacterized Tic20 family protein